MKILIGTLGSHGDVLPFLGLAETMKARGHEVVMVADVHFEPHVRAAGLGFAPMASAGDYERLLRAADMSDMRGAMTLLSSYVADRTPEVHAALKAQLEPGNTVVIGSSLMFGARLLRDTHDVPLATVHLAPAVFRSRHESPRVTGIDVLSWLPGVFKEMAWSLADRFVLDPGFARPLNEFRASQSLPPVDHVMRDWIHSPDLVMGLFPEWFAARHPDWPAPLELTGFPLTDLDRGDPLPASLAAFLADGEAPIGFTAGSAIATAADFYAASAQACARLGRRGLLITQFPEQLPERLPPGVIHVGYVPFSALLPRLAAFVHHGGIGSTSQALRAGVPQLIRPVAVDQFDNARHVTRLGVGRELLPRHYTADKAAIALDALCKDVALKARCRACAPRVQQPSLEWSCDVLLQRLTPLLLKTAATASPSAEDSSYRITRS
ncbi:MAG: hypothetical protein RLZZ618_3750 [Pseudomonadota bacterium]|jgi:UDP:flavonoid glycosyltransferase YjiC (YdhE family)